MINITINKKVRKVFLFILLTLFLHNISFAQKLFMQKEDIYAIAQAREHANKDVKKYRWFIGAMTAASVGGCITGSTVLISSYYFTPEPDIIRFLGKSPQYVKTYSKEYKRKVKNKQSAYSLLGCVSGSIVAMFIW